MCMSNPKMVKALLLLASIDRNPQSSIELARSLLVSRPTVVRLVEDLRGLGCVIESVREGMDWAYHLKDWGVFDGARVRKMVDESGPVAPTRSAGVAAD